MRSLSIPIPAGEASGRLRLSCIVLGHEAANRCGCQNAPFAEDGRMRHIRHVMSCFLGGHHFVNLVRRQGHQEYVCHACGHQLLLVVHESDELSFWRRPRYICSVFGHRVRPIAERSGLVEYVCGCGHSFMKRQHNLKKIKHPLTCTLLGHFVRFIGKRDCHSEYLCSVCGHTFCYRSRP
jgi:transposase-like protein